MTKAIGKNKREENRSGKIGKDMHQIDTKGATGTKKANK
ncbi:hypothetical protein SAMN05446037_100360 [Anaerovirgula multivorans]|uniref:Uncharacterized protein n=1 Tax=Anaerovirgula multivorans TaxID=312168 RepID=A0A239B826_9FIRM|nr:hypothetical protein SAMN05446037_100360 [Anaerovirgula multivorans]